MDELLDGPFFFAVWKKVLLRVFEYERLVAAVEIDVAIKMVREPFADYRGELLYSFSEIWHGLFFGSPPGLV